MGRLRFRQRWAVLAASGIYGAIARRAEQLGDAAPDRRIVVPRPVKLGHILRGFAQAILTKRPRHTPASPRRRGPRAFT